MSDKKEEDPETGAGGVGNTPVTEPGNSDTVGAPYSSTKCSTFRMEPPACGPFAERPEL